MNGQEAKSRVWAHWEYLRRLCERQFPGDANLGEEAFNHLLDTLNQNDWVRLRTWEEQGEFKTFLTVVAKRLLTDFRRKRSGYQRPPKWLREEIARENEGIEQRPMNGAGASRVSLWQLAYRVLYRDKCSRQEAIEKMLTQEPTLERKRASEMVTMILARCPAPIASPDASKQSLDALQDRESDRPDPLTECIYQVERKLEAVAGAVLDEGFPGADQLSQEQLRRFQEAVRLTEEERLILRLRFAEGWAVPTIAKRLGLEGDPYKYLKRILDNLKTALPLLEFDEVRERP